MDEGLTLPAFKSQIRSFEQLLADSAAEAIFKRMDTNSNGRIEPDECVLSLDTFREKLAKVKSLRNTFVDADSNSDHKLSRKE
ncbi:unnamed protein product [Effrenium voratum]|uniref:EF-hand domain-containing protein n=1 Tax=Effrenium voratum TaxID=2562239 RepID=A0AA36N345_9DINO|nr:unnamed protein product [Effrenium voratum]